jgi:hypothetical protein
MLAISMLVLAFHEVAMVLRWDGTHRSGVIGRQ